MKLALNGEIYEIGGESPSYTAGDGVSIESGAISLQNPMHGIYTQAEFNALSEEQKKSGTYIVDDGNNGGGSSSSSNIYSTEETRVGTWIDGKPLYRRTAMRYGLTGNTKDWIVAYTASSYEFVLMYYPFIHSQGSDKAVFGRAYTDMSSNKITFHFNQDTKVFQFWVTTTTFLPANVIINYYYTKTTDASPSETSSASLSTNVLTDVVDSITPSIMSTTMGISDAEEVSE